MINVGIIGSGQIGLFHAKTLTCGGLNARVAAIADPYMSDETASWSKSAGIPVVTLDYREILDSSDVDAVLICCSSSTYPNISIEAIETGKHVFCEKSIDHDPSRICAVLRALTNNPVKYQPGFHRRFDHNFRAVRDAVAAGKIGEVNVISITSREPVPPPLPYIEVSGGLFLDMMMHDFDMVRYLSGSEAEEVYAVGAVRVDSAIDEAGDIDTAIVSMRLKNGALAVIDNCRAASFGYDQRAEVFGSRGAVAVGNDKPSTAVISDAFGVTHEKPVRLLLERYAQAYREELSSFLHAIETDKETEVSAEDGLWPVLACLAARRSLLENRPVKIQEIMCESGIL